tara:strand:- start:5445 stop:6167 length:723 start_codon:yes stop_codon:yes gene_type:complete
MTSNNLDVSKLQNNEAINNKGYSEEFISENMPLIKNIANKILQAGKVPTGIDFEDLISWGIEGLLKAKKGFKKNLNTKFQTYAYYRIRGEILDSIRNEWSAKMPQDYREKKQKLQETLSNFIDDAINESSGSANDKVDRAIESATLVHYVSSEVKQNVSESKGTKNPEIEVIDENYDFLWKEIYDLDYPDKDVIELFYIHGLKQVEIADHLKLSKSRICRIHMNVLEKLKKRLQGSVANE